MKRSLFVKSLAGSVLLLAGFVVLFLLVRDDEHPPSVVPKAEEKHPVAFRAEPRRGPSKEIPPARAQDTKKNKPADSPSRTPKEAEEEEEEEDPPVAEPVFEPWVEEARRREAEKFGIPVELIAGAPLDVFTVPVIVLSELGTPVAGALVNVLPAGSVPGRELDDVSVDFPFHLVKDRGIPTTDERGMLGYETGAPPRTPGNKLYCVIAYHYEYGVGYELLQLDALRNRREPVTIYLKRGRAVTGRVIDNHGDPVAGARIVVFLGSMPGTPHLGRLQAVSGDDGSFRVAGILPGHSADLVSASVMVDYVPPDFAGILPPPGHPRHPKRAIRALKGISPEMFDEANQEWHVGDLVIDWEEARLWREEQPEESGGTRRQRSRRR